MLSPTNKLVAAIHCRFGNWGSMGYGNPRTASSARGVSEGVPWCSGGLGQDDANCTTP